MIGADIDTGAAATALSLIWIRPYAKREASDSFQTTGVDAAGMSNAKGAEIGRFRASGQTKTQVRGDLTKGLHESKDFGIGRRTKAKGSNALPDVAIYIEETNRTRIGIGGKLLRQAIEGIRMVGYGICFAHYIRIVAPDDTILI